MERLNDDIATATVPRAVLVAYENRSGYYLENHPVHDDGTIGAGAPVSRQFIRAITESFSDTYASTPYGMIPARLLYADTRTASHTLLWYSAPGKRHLSFTKAVPLEDGDYNMPGTLYLVQGNSLYVWCFEGRKPRIRAKLFKGPFWNCYHDNRMCLGNCRLDFPRNVSWDTLLQCWENIFWRSENAHLIDDPMIARANIVREYEAARTAPFNLYKCRQTETTLESILSKLK